MIKYKWVAMAKMQQCILNIISTHNVIHAMYIGDTGDKSSNNYVHTSDCIANEPPLYPP